MINFILSYYFCFHLYLFLFLFFAFTFDYAQSNLLLIFIMNRIAVLGTGAQVEQFVQIS